MFNSWLHTYRACSEVPSRWMYSLSHAVPRVSWASRCDDSINREKHLGACAHLAFVEFVENVTNPPLFPIETISCEVMFVNSTRVVCPSKAHTAKPGSPDREYTMLGFSSLGAKPGTEVCPTRADRTDFLPPRNTALRFLRLYQQQKNTVSRMFGGRPPPLSGAEGRRKSTKDSFELFMNSPRSVLPVNSIP